MNSGATPTTLKVLDPTGTVAAKAVSLAPRLATLARMNIGLVWNGKPRADVLLDYVGESLKKRYPTAKVVRHALPTGKGWSKPPAGALEAIASQIDAAVYACGD